MTRYLVEEVVTPGYSIDRGVYDNPKENKGGSLMNSFTFKGVTYEVIPNGNHFTVVDENGVTMVSVKNESDAETALKEHVLHCEELYRRNL